MNINFDTAKKLNFSLLYQGIREITKIFRYIVFFKRILFYVFYLLHSKNICLYLLPEEKNINILTVLKWGLYLKKFQTNK